MDSSRPVVGLLSNDDDCRRAAAVATMTRYEGDEGGSARSGWAAMTAGNCIRERPIENGSV